MKFKENEFAVLFKAAMFKDTTEYYPVKIIKGYYDEDECAFIDDERTMYYHIIESPENYGFAYRRSVYDLKKDYPHLPLNIIKMVMLHAAKKFEYSFKMIEEEMPSIIYYNKAKDTNILLLDDDIINFYNEMYPEFIKNLIREAAEEAASEEENKESEAVKVPMENGINFDVNDLYQKISSGVIGQDEPIKKILTAIWKQYNDFSNNKSRNILINGSTGVGKTEIFRILTKLLDIPCVIATATQYTAAGYVGKSVEDMLMALVTKANGDVEKAEHGILIIDEIDKISESSKGHSQVNQKDVQEALLKILEDGTFTLTKGDMFGSKPIEFNTNNLMVVGMGSWSRIELNPDKVVGFNSVQQKKSYMDITREDIVSNGMIPELVGRFSEIIQMNELTEQNFIDILNSVETSSLNLNKKFLEKQNIELVVDNETIKKIAAKAAKEKYGARSLDEIVETALTIASYEIATNPEKYSKLIITSETLEDNKKYTLVRKKEENM